MVKFERSPDPMELDTAAGIFVGQAGGADTDKFQVKFDLSVNIQKKGVEIFK